MSKRLETPGWIRQIKTPHVSTRNKIPVYAPYLIGNENKYANQALTSQWLSSKGDFIQKLEEGFARYCGAPFAVSCSSGTAALFLALSAAGINKNDEVIVPTFTMISTAFAVSYLGAMPIFIDCNGSSGNIDITAIERVITKKTKAIMPVHIYGNPCEMDDLRKIARKYHIQVIEDGAEALGSAYHGKKIGSISEFTAFSMYSNKIVTTGEGGIITLHSRHMYKKLKRLNNYSFSNIRHFWHQHIGYNFRLSNIQAAIGLAQVEHIETTLQKKQNIAQWYKELLLPIYNAFARMEPAAHTQTNNWMVAYRVRDSKFSVTKLANYLASLGIETRSFFLPLHLQPIYRRVEYRGKFPHAEGLAKTGILLPSGPGLKQSEVGRICGAIVKFFKS
ncbi:MAG: DegT/DnrJ/EryC1/StrS aminotransferase family protein [Candidatus Gottesmanbacteria bacterium]|nr:DegT/DnrJ/EryC1/StrS aminotransferase family protein [Candidatus Gottesmanbacteria bacterium]